MLFVFYAVLGFQGMLFYAVLGFQVVFFLFSAMRTALAPTRSFKPSSAALSILHLAR